MAPWTRTRPSTDSGATAAAPAADPYATHTADPYTTPTRGRFGDKHPAGTLPTHNERPRFHLMTWLRLHGVDLVTMALMGALGLGIYMAPPAPSRSFPLYFQDGEVVYPEFAYPLRKEIVPIWLAAFIAFMAPFVFFCLFQIRRRSLDDLLSTTMGLLKSLITAAVFQVWLKWLIGGLRPHFYAVCKPVVPAGDAPAGNGFGYIMYDRKICTGDKDQIDDSLESFPSGHATAAFAGLVFLSLYFNAQLKVLAAHNPAYWKMILFFAPILGATLIAGALTIDEFHNWYDVVAGAIIGTACALVAFRQTFAALWDFRFNHVLLPRATSLFHRTPYGGAGAPYYAYGPAGSDGASLPVAREGGWGWGEEGRAGAPGDATAMLSGAGAGTGAGAGVPGSSLGRAEAGMNGRRV